MLQSPPPLKTKFLIYILVAHYGEGHYATYNALRAIVEQQQLPWELREVDIGTIVNSLTEQQKFLNIYKLFGTTGDEFYNQILLQKGWTWIHPMLLQLNRLLLRLNYDTGVKLFAEYWREQQPDLVISTLPLYNKGMWESLQKGKPGTPSVTILTDFADSPPGFWLESETGNYFICGTERAIKQARDLGIKQEQIVKSSGLVINPRFYEPIKCDRTTERQRLGLAPDCPTGLVLFGGYGSNVMLEIAKRLECFEQKLQLIFICGRNEEVASEIAKLRGKQQKFVIGFTQDIPYYMHLADFFIGKPGNISISEAIVMKLPMIVQSNVTTLVQERYTSDWIKQKQVGLVIRNFRDIHKAVEQFLEPESFARYRANVAAINNRAVFEIPDILQNILANSNKTKVTEAFL